MEWKESDPCPSTFHQDPEIKINPCSANFKEKVKSCWQGRGLISKLRLRPNEIVHHQVALIRVLISQLYWQEQLNLAIFFLDTSGTFSRMFRWSLMTNQVTLKFFFREKSADKKSQRINCQPPWWCSADPSRLVNWKLYERQRKNCPWTFFSLRP